MHAFVVVIVLECPKLSGKIVGIPELGMIEILTTDRPDQAFDEGMQIGSKGDRLSLFAAKAPEIDQPEVKAKQRIIVGTETL